MVSIQGMVRGALWHGLMVASGCSQDAPSKHACPEAIHGPPARPSNPLGLCIITGSKGRVLLEICYGKDIWRAPTHTQTHTLNRGSEYGKEYEKAWESRPKGEEHTNLEEPSQAKSEETVGNVWVSTRRPCIFAPLLVKWIQMTRIPVFPSLV